MLGPNARIEIEDGDMPGADRRQSPARTLQTLRVAQSQPATGENADCLAHEISQPLSAVLCNAEAALRWLAKEPVHLYEAKQALARIIGNANRAGTIVSAARDLKRKHGCAATHIDINGMIAHILDLTDADLRRHAVEVEIELCDRPPPVAGHRDQLQQVIVNLVTNAIEAMSAVGRQRTLRIRTQSDTQGGFLVAVADSGAGLDRTKIERMFDPYFTTKRNGTGLGLWICRSIVESHGGRIWADSNLPHGSIFSFSLPAR